MPAALTYPGVYIEELSSGVRTITGVATSIALFIGWAPKGPVDRAVRLTSFADYQRTYGGLDLRSQLGYAVGQFYDNGGSDAYVIRLADTTAKIAKCKVGTMTIEASSPGDWANTLNIVTTKRTDDATRFRLEVTDANGVVLESFANLSMVTTDPRYALTAIKGRSSYLGTITTTTTSTPPADGTVQMSAVTAGDPGKVMAPDAGGPLGTKFLVDMLALFGVGGIADQIDLFNIVCVPGLASKPDIAKLQKAVRDRRAFLVVDSAETATLSTVVGTLETGADAGNSAVYFPWVLAPDPLQEGAVRAFPPCGFIAGIYARTDASRGVWKAPAGTEASVTGAAGLVFTLSDAENGQLNPAGVNCLRTMPVYGNIVWGARTLHGADERGDEWKYVPVRRMALFLEESLYRGTQWVVFEPNDEPLWAQIRLNIGAFLQGLFRQGAFQGKTPKEAYFVKCDRETTTQADINNGIVNILVGFAPLKPAEFVVIKIQQMAGDLQT
ncbi:MAG: phage tail sheath subtilisin-like domain-containing protein [Sphingomicrobium sp.]